MMEDDATDNESPFSLDVRDSRHFRSNRTYFRRRRPSSLRMISGTIANESNATSACTSGEFGRSLEDSLVQYMAQNMSISGPPNEFTNLTTADNNINNRSADGQIRNQEFASQHSDNLAPTMSNLLCHTSGELSAVGLSIPSSSFSATSAATTIVCDMAAVNATSSQSQWMPYSNSSLQHLYCYENHLSRISMYDEEDELDEYGHYDPYEDLHLPRIGRGRDTAYNASATMGMNGNPWAFPSVSMAHPSGLYMDDIPLTSNEGFGSTVPTPREINQHQIATNVASTTVAASDPQQSNEENEVADVDCYPLTNTSSAAHGTASNAHPAPTTAIPVGSLRVVDSRAVSEVVRGGTERRDRGESTDNEVEMSHHVVCMMDNHRASLFCRSFSETHNHHTISLDIPVCVGLFGWRIIQEPYCRLYSVVEYKVKIIINHQEYNVWKRYEDFVKLATSCQRLSAYYSSNSTSRVGRTGFQYQNVSDQHEKKTKSSWLPSCLCPNDTPMTIPSSSSLHAHFSTAPIDAVDYNRHDLLLLSSSRSSSWSSGISVIRGRNMSISVDEVNMNTTLAIWQKIQEHRPCCWLGKWGTFQPAKQLTRFACEESQLLELFLQHLLFEVPNMQLICEFIM